MRAVVKVVKQRIRQQQKQKQKRKKIKKELSLFFQGRAVGSGVHQKLEILWVFFFYFHSVGFLLGAAGRHLQRILIFFTRIGTCNEILSAR